MNKRGKQITCPFMYEYVHYIENDKNNVEMIKRKYFIE